MNQASGRNSAPLIPIRPPPPPPVSSSAAPGNGQQQDATATSSSKKLGGMNLSKLLPKRMQKQTSVPAATGVKKAVPPPRPPPPKFAPKQPVLIDLLSGSPPSSPSPTLRSQESGFEESPDVWRSWPESAASTPQVDWTLTSNSTPSLGQANVDPWSMDWSSQTETTGWADFSNANNFQQQRQLSEVKATTMPTISTSALATPSSTFYTAAAKSAALQTAPSMPTIIRPGATKKPVKKIEEVVQEDELDTSFHLPMPCFPPPVLPPEVDDVSSEPSNFLVVAIYDYESDHPDDLKFKVGDVIEVLSSVNEDWYTGQCDDRVGHFPASFVEPQ